METQLTVREMSEKDIVSIVNYWLQPNDDFMKSMGVDVTKIPDRNSLYKMLTEQLEQNYPEKKSYCIIWEINNVAVGHCNVNKIKFGEEAFLHLHLWETCNRQKGIGNQLLKQSIPYFFNNLQLKKLYSEPYSLNAAPNKTLEKAGFRFVKKHTCIPGNLNFEQEVNLWEMDSPILNEQNHIN